MTPFFVLMTFCSYNGGSKLICDMPRYQNLCEITDIWNGAEKGHSVVAVGSAQDRAPHLTIKGSPSYWVMRFNKECHN